MIRSYSELMSIPTFEERFEYLKLNGTVGEMTFGSKRYLNQTFYRSSIWKSLRNRIIIRDNGCDLGIEDRPIYGRVIIHHINPLTELDVLSNSPSMVDPENLICVSHMTHEAITYGDNSLLIPDLVERTKFDTCPWKR